MPPVVLPIALCLFSRAPHIPVRQRSYCGALGGWTGFDEPSDEAAVREICEN